MLNISWGTKIAILYISFVILIITMVTLSMNQKIDLVSEDYYARELKFQTKINEMNNANALPEKVAHTIESNGLVLQFPEFFKNKNITGDILFFRPSDASKDIKMAVHLNDELKQLIPFDMMSKGMYKMQINWAVDTTSYFIEQIIVIP